MFVVRSCRNGAGDGKMRTLAFIIFYMAAVIGSVSVAAVPDGYTQISNNAGLSNSSVTSIFQDSEDEMWFGTWNGLNRYDGNILIQYRPQSASDDAISHQVIRSIDEDKDGYLWIATDFGINRMDRDSGKFTCYFLGYGRSYIYEEGLFSCCVSDEGTVTAALKGGNASVYDKASDTFMPIEGCEDITVSEVLFFDKEGKLWVQTSGGDLAWMTLDGNRAGKIHEIQLPEYHGRPIFDGNDRVWVQDGEDVSCVGIYSADPVPEYPGLKIMSTLNTVRNIDGKLYAGTTTGCYAIGTDYSKTSVTGEKISVLSLFRGTQDILWLGTDGLGVLKEKYRPEFISALYPSPAVSGRFPVRAILIDSHDNIYIGSKGGGLSVRGSGEQTFRNFNVGPGKTYNSVLALEEDGDRIFIGTDGDGLLFMDRTVGSPKRLDLSGFPEGSRVSSVYTIEKSGDDTLYLGTSGNGLFRIIMENGKAVSVTNYRHEDDRTSSIGSNIIYDIADDGRYLWLATRGGGLNRFDKRSGTAKILTGSGRGTATSNDILSLLTDSAGRIWAGSSSGLIMVTRQEDGTFGTRLFDETSGLPNTDIHAILEGCDGSIWASTDKGMARLDRDGTSISSWTYDDGLSDNEFCDGACFAADDGSKLYFGSVGGVDIISPELVKEVGFIPKLNLSMVEVDNTRYLPCGNVISTDYRSGSISLKFSLPDYVSGGKCSVAYFLKRGRDKDYGNIKESEWIDIGESRQIIVSQLRPGNYTLLVRAVGADREFGIPQSWLIEVSWPMLLTPWLILLYCCIAAAVVCVLYWLHKSKKAISEELEQEKRDNAVKEEIVQAKFRFFTNIAHEFSNSITLIFGAVEQIFSLDDDSGKCRKQLIAIRSNADRMHRQIQELMEFSKADSGHLPVLYEKVDVNELLKYTFDNFMDVAESKKIKLAINAQEGLPQWVSDRSMLEKIVFNLISNAMKYTPAEGSIDISAMRGGDGSLVISVRNSGPGIPQDKLKVIFDRYVILDNFESKLSHGHYTRSGIGLALCKDLTELLGGTISVESKVDEYTMFSVSLPWKDDTDITRASQQPSGPSEWTGHHSGKRPVILVVDDSAGIRMLISDILSDSFDTLEAKDAENAMEIMKDVTPALVISDMIMPGMGGIEFVKKMKSSEKTKGIPVVMLSCDTDIENRVNAIDTGADMFIAKPFHPRYLKAVVDRMLQDSVPGTAARNSLESVIDRVDGIIPETGTGSFTDKVMEALSKNFSDENYNQDALAYDLAMSRVQLYRKVKHELGTTPGELIRRYRIRQAEIMLARTDKTVQEIMYDCGFHNKAYFYREFSRLHNCSPKDFRNTSKTSA